jgi:dTDP-4-amino-4,6-dideoxygalactose transaminase
VVTQDTALYDKLCRMRNFGFNGYLNCVDLGINGKMDELSALLGLKLLDRLPVQTANRKWVFRQYREALQEIEGIVIPNGHRDVATNYSVFNVIIDPETFGLTNLELNYALTAENIVTRCYFYPPVHRTIFYRDRLSAEPPDLPETDWAALHVLCLPVYGDMRVDEMAKVVEGIRRCRKYSSDVRRKVASHIPQNWESMKC